MIRPESLQSLISTCEDDAWLGRVLRAVGGQKVPLDPGQRAMVRMLTDINARDDERRERERERQKRLYDKRKKRCANGKAG